MKRAFKNPFVITSVLAIILICQGCAKREIRLTGELLNSMPWREIGPASFAGRISDIAVNPKDHRIIYVSPSTGGIFKTTDDGLTWQPVFDHAGNSLAIGDIDVSLTNPDIIWAGTGEASGEQSPASIGDGIYKSVDGGKTWTNMGLEKTRHFSKVVIHPENPDIVFAGATGSRWGADNNRGVFRTKDGGQTWEKVLFIDENTGISDILVMPGGNTVFASAWEQRRNAWAHVRMGPSSGLYRSDDGGDTWKKVEGGLPTDNIGRIALAVAPTDKNRLYAALEHDSLGFFRSDDGGSTWTHLNRRVKTAYWYGRIFVDPTNADRVWAMGTSIQETTDGGESFHPVRMRGVHVDHHVAWFDPSDASHIILGNDGGLYFTHDGGQNWDFIASLPIGQYYDISIDTRVPYRIYGGLQDNGVFGGPSRSETGKPVTNSDIYNVSGGDGFYSGSEPDDPGIGYGESQFGGIVRFNIPDNKRSRIKPRQAEGEELRFNWNTPFFVSEHDPNMLYIGGNKLFRSDDMGETWDTISPDLSKNLDLDTVLVIGQKPTLKAYCSITALSESPIRKGLIYAGTDDGNLQVTMDDGVTWQDISDNIPAPKDRFFTRLVASRFDEATAYAAFGRFYEASDFSPYLFKTTDYGKTWVPVKGNLPDEAIVLGLAEYPGNPLFLFTGTHNGLFMSTDGGTNWTKINGQLPNVAVSDIIIAPDFNDLILGTYGRSLWIMDDISFLNEAGADILGSDIHLFEPKWVESTIRKDSVFTPDKYDYVAPEPMSGLVITYYCKNEITNIKNLPELSVTDKTGSLKLFRKLPGHKGFNRISDESLDLEPGEYTVEIKAGRKSSSVVMSVK